MKKAAIISIHDLCNLGNRLQNYALNRVLNRMKISTINIIKERKNLCLKVVLKSAIHGEFGEAKRIIRFKMFDNKYLKIINYNKKINYDKHCDLYVCGSDQIWNPMIFDKWYFADFAMKKKISYAASFGVDELPISKENEYRNELKKFTQISVREEMGKEIIKKLNNVDVNILIDPTMLLDNKEWERIEKKPRYIDDKQKYILMYFLGTIKKEYIDYINAVASRYEYKIINICGKEKNKYWYSTGPSEFLWLINNSEMVCTDSFHGSVFSILYNKPFLVFERFSPVESMNSRLMTLLNIFKLQGRLYRGQEIENIIERKYEHIPAILEIERNKAMKFLKDAMEIE